MFIFYVALCNEHSRNRCSLFPLLKRQLYKCNFPMYTMVIDLYDQLDKVVFCISWIINFQLTIHCFSNENLHKIYKNLLIFLWFEIFFERNILSICIKFNKDLKTLFCFRKLVLECNCSGININGQYSVNVQSMINTYMRNIDRFIHHKWLNECVLSIHANESIWYTLNYDKQVSRRQAQQRLSHLHVVSKILPNVC